MTSHDAAYRARGTGERYVAHAALPAADAAAGPGVFGAAERTAGRGKKSRFMRRATELGVITFDTAQCIVRPPMSTAN